LLSRARTSYDMRMSDPTERRRAAVQFANTPGYALDDSLLQEIEAALDDPDPLVRETALFTAMEIYRFRAIRTADLAVAHQAVKKLAAVNHHSVVPILIEILENPRSGYIRSGDEMVETDNNRSRMVALLRLVEWHTPAARQALQMRLHDPDKAIVAAARKALDLFPGPWSGPLKKRRGAAKAAGEG
jgi:HEAT repeat protein